MTSAPGGSQRSRPVDSRRIQCPVCSSQSVRRAKRDERPDHYIALRAWRVCEMCGAVFEPPSSLTLCVIFSIASIALALATVRWFVIPGIMEIRAGDATVFRSMLKLVLGLFGVAGFSIWAAIGVKKARHSWNWMRRSTFE